MSTQESDDHLCTCYGPPIPSHWEQCPAAYWNRRAEYERLAREKPHRQMLRRFRAWLERW